MALLELSGVTRSVVLPDGSDLHILRGVNLEVEAGEQVSIVGRSGTGKSTLLNIMGLLDKPSSGAYSIDGQNVLRLGEGGLARLRGSKFGFVFQQFNIFNARTAQENVEVPLLYASGPQFWRRHDLSAKMLDRVGLGDRLDSYPTQMSGGEQQRIAIARALVRKPRIILADEPTGALDPDTGRSVMGLLEEVAAENNAALIVITHDLNVAVRADRVLSLYDGVLHHVENAREVLVPTQLGDGASSQVVGVPTAPPAELSASFIDEGGADVVGGEVSGADPQLAAQLGFTVEAGAQRERVRTQEEGFRERLGSRFRLGSRAKRSQSSESSNGDEGENKDQLEESALVVEELMLEETAEIAVPDTEQEGAK